MLVLLLSDARALFDWRRALELNRGASAGLRSSIDALGKEHLYPIPAHRHLNSLPGAVHLVRGASAEGILIFVLMIGRRIASKVRYCGWYWAVTTNLQPLRSPKREATRLWPWLHPLLKDGDIGDPKSRKGGGTFLLLIAVCVSLRISWFACSGRLLLSFPCMLNRKRYNFHRLE